MTNSSSKDSSDNTERDVKNNNRSAGYSEQVSKEYLPENASSSPVSIFKLLPFTKISDSFVSDDVFTK